LTIANRPTRNLT